VVWFEKVATSCLSGEIQLNTKTASPTANRIIQFKLSRVFLGDYLQHETGDLKVVQAGFVEIQVEMFLDCSFVAEMDCTISFSSLSDWGDLVDQLPLRLEAKLRSPGKIDLK